MSVLDYAIRIIKATMKNHSNESFFPYFFIVGAGISVPEIPAAYEIIDECKDKSKKFDEISYIQFENEIKSCETNPMRCYSKWIEFAYPNRIDRSNLFKRLNATAKISSANLLLAQILDSGKFANTVFTTNFDDSLKRALNLIGTKEFVSAENSMDNLIINNHTKEIQIVHVHGTYRFYDCANLENEITEVAGQSGTVSSAHLLDTFLIDQAPIIVGYSGWENDVIMKRIKERISYPTPLQYIWVCYNQKSYDKLPDWLKESSSFIFVVPVIHDEICEDTSCGNDFINKVDEPVIDASLFYILLPYFQLSPSIVSKREKNEKLILIKSLKGIGSEFYNLLEKLYATGCISDLSQCNADVASLVYFIDKESTAYSAYCEGDRDKAEKLFTEVSQSDFLHVSEMAKTNILYMIRRKEARTTRSFWEVLDEKKILSAFDYMNIILQCLSTDDRQNPHFSRAMKQIECLEPEEISGLVDWWNNTLLVGTEESKLALSIIYSEFHNG